MPTIGPELIAEVVPTVLYAAIAGALTVAGAFAEYNSLQHLGSGDLTLAVWFGVFGAILLYAGVYGLAYQKVVGAVA